MTTKTLPAILALGWLAAPAAPQSGIQGPVAGFVPDAGLRAIRPINGMPGASTLGDPVPLGFPVRHAAISGALDFALAVSDDDGALYLVRGLASGTPRASALAGAPGGVARIVLNGGAALLYSPAGNTLQAVTGLPDRPEAAPPRQAPPGEIAALALAPGGARFAAAARDAVYSYSPDGGPHLLASADDVSALAFRADGRDLVYARRAANQVVLVGGIDGNGNSSVLADETDGVNEPVALLSLDGGRRLWIANAGSATALVLDDAAPGAPLTLPLAAAPTRCDPLDAASLLILNEPGSGPLVLAGWTGEPKAWFVPAEVSR